MNAGLHTTSPLGDADLVRTDQAHYVHGYHMFDDHRINGSLSIATGDGAYIYDTACNHYLDTVGGMWCINISLGHEEMARTAVKQTRLLAYSSPFYGMASPHTIELCRKLAELTPDGPDHVFLTTGGSTAMDTTIRLMHYYQNCRGKRIKEYVITRVNAYHGSTLLDVSLGDKGADRPTKLDFPDERIHHLVCLYYYCAPERVGEIEFLGDLVEEFERKILELGAGRVGASISEPMLGSGDVIVPPAGYRRRIWELCQCHDVLYISNEVVTPFGRLGHFFASQVTFGVQPDVTLTVKDPASGYQSLGACIFSRCIWEVIIKPDKGRYFNHGFTYSDHPVIRAAALKDIGTIKCEGLLAYAGKVGRYFEERLQSLRSLSIVGDVRETRFMACVGFVADKASRALFPKSLNTGEWVHLRAQKRDLLVRSIIHLNVMSPPLTLTCEQTDTVVQVLRESIEEAVKDLVRAGHR